MKTQNTNKRVVFTMGGKGGVGKTGLMVALAEWFEAHEIPVTLLDLDTENKARGSLKHFFNGSVTKVNIHTPAGLDTFIDHLESGASIILADMGAGSGQVASEWFDTMYEDISATGARFTAVGVITPDPASVESVLAWANRLQDRAQYVVVQNATSPQANFSYWDSAEQAMRFRESLSPTVVQMEFRLAELENPARQYGVRLGQVAARQNSVDELKRASIVMRGKLPPASVLRVRSGKGDVPAMSDQEFVATAETQAETSTLFDELAGLVPEERRQSTTESSRTRVRSAPTMRCSGYLKQWVSWRCSREKRPQRSPQSASCYTRFWKPRRLRPVQSSGKWSSTQRALNRGSPSCRRSWNQGWTRLALRNCSAKVFDSHFSGAVCQTPQGRLVILVPK